jgi:Putative metallopeptidase
MKWIVGVAVVLAATSWSVVRSTPAAAQELRNPQIDIAYVEPANPAYREIYERLKKRQVLEELRAFLAPLKLPERVLIKIDQCDGASIAPYTPKGPVTICYEYINQFERVAPADLVLIGPEVFDPTGNYPGLLRRDDALTGAFVQHALHEFTIAAFEILQVPLWGREEFAADNVTAFIMLQFGKEIAWKTVVGTAWLLAQTGATGIGEFYSARSPDAQRFFNYLCTAYVSDPVLFGFVVKNGTLPQERAKYCKQDYEKLKYSFDATIMPHIDQDLLKQVRAGTWLKAPTP